MIEAQDFVHQARSAGFDFYAGVPCSFLSPFIDHVIDAPDLSYVSAANEGDAVALAAGATLGGRGAVAMMQNSGLGNAVNPLISLTHPFRIPLLLIVTLRGDPEHGDEPQHLLMGEITRPLLERMHIPWELFPTEARHIPEVLGRACAHMARVQRPYALILRKGSVAKCGHSGGYRGRRWTVGQPDTRLAPEGERPARADILARLQSLTPDPRTVLIGTTGYTARELYALEDRANQFYMVGSMGCACPLGLGLAQARPDLRVVVVDGDGALLMRLGSLATAGAYAGSNFYHLLLDNEAYDSTGAQATVSPAISFAAAARACGYDRVLEGTGPELLEQFLTEPAPEAGPHLLALKTRTGTCADLPRPSIGPEEVRARFMTHINATLPWAPDTGTAPARAKPGRDTPAAILLNPGPVTLSERVRKALLRADLCHREPEFVSLQERIRAALLAVYGLDPGQWGAVPLPGSGTSAVEAMLVTLVPADGRLLVLANGVYGERMTEIARRHGIDTRELVHPWEDGLDLQAAALMLQTARPTHVAVVQHETTTGRLNDLEAIGALCRKHGVSLLVDAVSAFGAEVLDFEGWGITAAAATANKCLHGVPGVGIVVARRTALAQAAHPPRSLALDLGGWWRAQETGSTPFTPAVQALYALDEALHELAEGGGQAARLACYRARATYVHVGLVALGFEPLLPDAVCSQVLRAYRLPAGITYTQLHDALKAHGFVIYAGQGALAEALFRISPMGEIGEDDLPRLLQAFAAAHSR